MQPRELKCTCERISKVQEGRKQPHSRGGLHIVDQCSKDGVSKSGGATSL